MALRAAREPCGARSVTRAFGYLNTAQTAAHGYALLPGAPANSQSTSWAVQARHTCHLRNRKALAWLAARQLSSGAFNYQPGVTTTPAWVTGQVLPAINGRSYPVR
jgi:hypothetical protein